MEGQTVNSFATSSKMTHGYGTKLGKCDSSPERITLKLHDRGIDPDMIGAHSLCAGGAMALKIMGYADSTICKFGRWTSNTWMVYIHSQISKIAPPVTPGTGAGFLMIDENEENNKEEEDAEETMFSFNMMDETVRIDKKHLINPMWILLDSASTVNMFSNMKLLKNIRHCGSIKGLCIYTTNGGT